MLTDNRRGNDARFGRGKEAAMTFNLAEVRGFAADLYDRMERCDNGEGMVCATLDATLKTYATICCTFSERLRRWGREVFAGRVAFDPAVEEEWLQQGTQLYSRALEMLAQGQKVEGPCYTLDGQGVLYGALSDLYRLLRGWVTPKRAVGPGARQGLKLEPTAEKEARQRIANLPPLPANWQPDNARQQMRLRHLRKQQSS
jgi:hypothetical protein